MLRQYCRTARVLMQSYETSAAGIAGPVPISDLFSPPDGADIPEAWLLLRQWYASLYAVIEGWKRLDLSDRSVNFALAGLKRTGAIRILKEFRNSVYHFSPHVVDERQVDLMLAGAADGTIGRLVRFQDAVTAYLDQWKTETDLSGIGWWQRD